MNLSQMLYYKISEGNEELIIEVRGSLVFDSEGNDVGRTALITKKVLESKELAGILNFTVNK